MAESKKHKPVTFLTSRGEEVSNDPIWHAQRVLRDAGMSFDAGQPAAAAATLRATAAGDDDDLGEDATPDLDESGARTYKELDKDGLKSLAAARGVDIKGMRKVGEVRDALRAADVEAGEAGASGTSNASE